MKDRLRSLSRGGVLDAMIACVYGRKMLDTVELYDRRIPGYAGHQSEVSPNLATWLTGSAPHAAADHRPQACFTYL